MKRDKFTAAVIVVGTAYFVVITLISMLLKNFVDKIRSWFKKPEKKSLKELRQESHPEPVKPYKPGRGPYFTNNRKRTRGRNIQYIAMPNGSMRVIRHETV